MIKFSRKGGTGVYGLYQQTICRKGQITTFTIQPLEFCSYAKDGLITCQGEIGFYDYQMPIALEGNFDKKHTFHVISDRLPIYGDENVLLLNYLAPWLSEKKKTSICGNLFEKTEEDLRFCGLNKNQSRKLFRDLKQLKEKKRLVQLLLAYGISSDQVEVVLKKNVSYQDFLYHPYHLCRITDIDFYTIDAIALQIFHFNPYSVMRLCAFVRNVMDLTIKNGNTCITAEALLRATNIRLHNSIAKETILTAALLAMCVQELHFVSKEDEGKLYFYDKDIAQEEDRLIEQIIRLQSSKQELEIPDIEEIEKKLNITYTHGQRKVFQALKTTGIKILTGPPGSGKTAVIKGLIQKFHAVKLSATTGRASQVLMEACQKEATTVHKLLDIRPYGENLTSKNINNPIQAELIIVDEVSMMGLKLASLLLQAVKNTSILLLVGDIDQLQSVEYGNVLSDLIHSGYVETYSLTEVVRQKGSILQNAKLINEGCTNLLVDQDFHYAECQDADEILSLLEENVRVDDQILTTIKKGKLGTRALNEKLQDKKTVYCTSFGDVDYYEKNRIIMTETSYEAGYFNGDMGIILKMDSRGLAVQFKDKILHLSRKDIACMELAYAVTTHKAQGSEFQRVHIILPDECTSMLTRRMIYTAITRAKKEVFIYSVNKSLLLAIKNCKEKPRISILKNHIKKFVQNK